MVGTITTDGTCNNCGKKGHLQADCKSSKAVHEVQNDEPSFSIENTSFLGAVHNAKTSNKEWSIEVCLDNAKINFKIDTGADVDIISDKIYTSDFSHKPLLPSTKNLKGPDRKHLPILGYIKCSISKGDKSTQSDVYVMKGGTPLLGRESSATLGVVALIDNIQSHPQLFKGLGEMPMPYKIEIQPEAQPYAVLYPRRVAVPLMPKVKKELDRLEALGVIKRVT